MDFSSYLHVLQYKQTVDYFETDYNRTSMSLVMLISSSNLWKFWENISVNFPSNSMSWHNSKSETYDLPGQEFECNFADVHGSSEWKQKLLVKPAIPKLDAFTSF